MPRAPRPSTRFGHRTSLTFRTLFAGAGLLSATLFIGAGCRGCSEAEAPAAAPVPVVAAVEAEEPNGEVDALTPPPPPGPPDLAMNPLSMNGDPRGPRQEEFDRVHALGQQAVQTCLDKLPATVVLPGGSARLMIRYEVGNDGKPGEVSVTGELPAETLACGKTAIDALAFPRFEGPGIRNAFSLTYSRAPSPEPTTKK